jgi:hypothetical protein
MVCHFKDEVITHIGSSLFPSIGTTYFGKKYSNHVERTLKQCYGEILMVRN